MDARRGTIAVLTRGAVALQLVQPVERHVEPVAASYSTIATSRVDSPTMMVWMPR